MRDYEVMLKRKAQMPDVSLVKQDIDEAASWAEAYHIGQFVNEQTSGDADKLVMDAYEKAFSLGLNIRTDRRCFLIATQQIARIYFQFRMYDEAINKLMLLDVYTDNLPDWVNLYYAAAQIHTENVLHLAEIPSLLFKRIDGINEDDPESVKRRKYLFMEFLNRIRSLSETKDISRVDADAILAKASNLGIADSRECLNFKVALGIIPALPELSDEPTPEAEQQGKNASVYEQMVAELNKRLSELQAIIEKQKSEVELGKKIAAGQQKQIADLQEDKKAAESKAALQSDELKASREREYALQAKCSALESQLSGSGEAKQRLAEDASVIGELKSDVEDLKTALMVSRKNNEKLQAQIDQGKSEIGELNAQLQQSLKESQKLNATVESQKAQIEIMGAAVKAAEERAAEAKTVQGSEDTDKPRTTVPQQPTLVDILTVDNFLPRKQKILIIGGSETKENHLRGKLKSMGFDFSKDQLEFELEYDNVKDYASRIVPWSNKYAGIIIGPCPHKARDIDGYSSFIEQLKAEEGYPHVEEARDKSGTLKISNASIGEAMMKMAVYLLSVA